MVEIMNENVNIFLPGEVVVGKDILELVSSSMYVDPLTIYREYVQNSADSIEEAKTAGILGDNEAGRIDITIDTVGRTLKIRDNGTGVPNGEFAKRLLSIGGSQKRGTAARGFRGVGRLAGLGYCQEVVFRSRAAGDAVVQELRWDCRIFKRLLSEHAYHGTIHDIIQRVASVTALPSADWPEHFYEVELIKPIRIKSDILLNSEAIEFYLSQVGPVPFSPEFRFGAEIRSRLVEHLGCLGEVEIYIDGADTPVYRPYGNDYACGEAKRDEFTDVEFRIVEGLHGGVSAVVWLLHHGYHGSIPPAEGISGLRARKGDIQVGDYRIFAEAFPESRFAGWTVGEVHILDERVMPNGRRDDFEQNAHYNHLLTRLVEVGNHIGRMCRSSSVVRNRIKAFDIGASKIDEQLKILEQAAVDGGVAENIVENIRSDMFEIQKVTEAPVLAEADRTALSERFAELEQRLANAKGTEEQGSSLSHIPAEERAVVQKMIGLIYECSTNRVAAKALVDRILVRMGG